MTANPLTARRKADPQHMLSEKNCDGGAKISLCSDNRASKRTLWPAQQPSRGSGLVPGVTLVFEICPGYSRFATWLAAEPSASVARAPTQPAQWDYGPQQ